MFGLHCCCNFVGVNGLRRSGAAAARAALLPPAALTSSSSRRRRCYYTAGSVKVTLDGVEHGVAPLWLRLKDPASFTPNGQRLLEIGDVVGTTVSATHFDRSETGGGLTVTWDDGSSSFFSTQWLRSELSSASAASEQKPRLWKGGDFRQSVPEVDHAELTEGGKLRVAQALCTYGIALLRNVPCEPGTVLDVGNTLGHVRDTNYGDLFEVVDLGAAGNNLAQTNVHIRAHTDNPYRDPFPGVQLLHCLANATAGGATSFVDGFACAEVLRREAPEAFAQLSARRHPFAFRDRGVELETSAPVLTLAEDGVTVERVCFNNRSAGVIELADEADLVDYYRAWAQFDEICNREENRLKIELKPGDLAIFLNSRVMHGRDEYTAGAGRHIQGCYIDHDAVRSRVDCAAAAAAAAADHTLAALATQEQFCYGEGLDMLQHALQAAHCAALAGEDEEAVLAALMHDVGNSPQARAVWEDKKGVVAELMKTNEDGSIGYRHHAAIGADFLAEQGFSPSVVNAVGLHVSAKRALVGLDAAYLDELSQASIDTLAEQGGPMSAEECKEFQATLGADIALRLRRYDDQGKDVDLTDTPQLGAYREPLRKHLQQQQQQHV